MIVSSSRFSNLYQPVQQSLRKFPVIWLEERASDSNYRFIYRFGIAYKEKRKKNLYFDSLIRLCPKNYINCVTRMCYERSVPIVTPEKNRCTEYSLIDILILSILFLTVLMPLFLTCLHHFVLAPLSCSFKIVVLLMVNRSFFNSTFIFSIAIIVMELCIIPRSVIS